jgi:putative RecB family exonuclease
VRAAVVRVVTVEVMATTAHAGNGVDRTDDLPSRLSPSRALDFIQCPAKFFFKSIERLPSTPTLAMVRGTVAHAAMERVFDHPRPERTPDVAVTYVEPAWRELLDAGGHDHLDGDEVVRDASALVRAWFGVEDPTRFDPADRELRLAAEVAGVSVIGILDRVDKMTRSDGSEMWVISDYKTGKVPAPNDRFLNEKFFGMEVYAVLLHASTGVVADALRLVYVAGGTPDAVRVRPCDAALVDRTTKRLRGIWSDITTCARTGSWPCRTGPLCRWCDFQMICPAWTPQLDGADVGGSASGN